MGRIAILVLAHRAEPLAYLLAALDPAFAVFVHMDARAEPPPLPPHARLIAPRTEIFWGGWSMMQATFALIAAARAAGPYDRYVLISGDSLPVRPTSDLVRDLLDLDCEFVDLVAVPDDPSLAGMAMPAAIARDGWVQPWRLHNPVAWDHRLLNPFHREAAAAHYGLDQERADWIRGDLERLTRDLLRSLQPPRPFAQFAYGAQWWALTAATLEALLPTMHDPAWQRFFQVLQVPDEHMIQTALANRQDLLAGRRLLPTPMWTDQARRAAGTGTLDDAGFAAAAADHLFARKFDPVAAPATAAAIASARHFPKRS